MTETDTPAGITVAAATDAGRSEQLATTLAAAYDITSTLLHLDSTPVAAEGQTDEEALAAAIADRIPAAHLLVVESEHADRWRSRHSVAEHLIDAHAHSTVALGPAGSPDVADGPIVVALDGSAGARSSLGPAKRLADAVGRRLLLTTVVPEPLDAEPPHAEAEAWLQADAEAIGAEAAVIASNDPVTALVSLAASQQAAFIVLASAGGRETKRSSMSRTAAGLIAEASCPVLVTRAAAG